MSANNLPECRLCLYASNCQTWFVTSKISSHTVCWQIWCSKLYTYHVLKQKYHHFDEFSLLTTTEAVKMTMFSVVSDENLIKGTTFLCFDWFTHILLTEFTVNKTKTTLTHWGPVTHICLDNLTAIGSDNGLSPSQRQAIIWTNARILLIGP